MVINCNWLTIGHMLWEMFIVRNWQKPSLASATLTLRESWANSGCKSSKYFQAFASAGCLKFPSFGCCVACHLIAVAVSSQMSNLCGLGVSGKYRITLAGIVEPSALLSIHVSFNFNREGPHVWQLFDYLFSSKNNIQSFGHACIFS